MLSILGGSDAAVTETGLFFTSRGAALHGVTSYTACKDTPHTKCNLIFEGVCFIFMNKWRGRKGDGNGQQTRNLLVLF